MTSDERWQTIKRIFGDASERPIEERADFVRAAAGADRELADEVMACFAGGAQLGDFLEPPARDDELRAGERIGGFTLVSEIGRGGMGVVWIAEQDSPRRTVALKVLQSSSLAGEDVRRFRREADLLARLSHPNVAQVYEAGTHECGGLRRPWFALELVEGRTLDEHVQFARLDLRARVELFVKVCAAVQHAHERGIVHRDLKPGNVLVTAAGEPKVLDFGIARVIGLDREPGALRTRTGLLLGTLDYMSPEQLAGDPDAVDARSDVYALGVMLHELLAGRRPHDVRGRPLPEALAILSTAEPTSISRWNKELRGDLETIVAKALAKERQRRYASAAELALELERFLEERPIAARPASTMYQLGKFARRNKALVAGVSATLLVLAAGATTSTLLYLREVDARVQATAAKERAQGAEQLAERRLAETRAALAAEAEARARAERETERALRTKTFLLHIYDSVDPMQARGQDVTVRAVIDEEAQRLEGELLDEPEVKAELFETLGLVYRGLGAYERAREVLTRAVDLRRAALGDHDPRVADALLYRASLSVNSQDHFDEALADAQRAIAICRAAFGEEHDQTVLAHSIRAGLSARRGTGGGAWDAMASAAVPMLAGLEEAEFPDAARAMVLEVRDLVDADDMAGAKAALWRFYVESTEELRRLWSSGQRDRARAQIQAHVAPVAASPFWRSVVPALVSGVATWMHAQGEDPDAVEPLLREALTLAEQIPDVAPTATARVVRQLADFLRDRGENTEAREHYERALELNRRLKGEQHEDVAYALTELARLALAAGERTRARELACEAESVYRAVRAAGHPDVTAAEQLLAECSAKRP